MRTVSAAMATLSIAVLTAGLIWPHLAMIFLRALVVTLALAYMVARIYRSNLPAALASDSYSPFEGVASRFRPSETHPAIRHLSTLLQDAADPDRARRAPIPAEARRILTAEVSRRLAEHHGLSPLRSDGHDRVRALLSDATWSLVRAEPTQGAGPSDLDQVPMSLLENILDDVERL